MFRLNVFFSEELLVKCFHRFLFVGFFQRNDHDGPFHVFSFNRDTDDMGVVYAGLTQDSMPMTGLTISNKVGISFISIQIFGLRFFWRNDSTKNWIVL